MARRYDSADAKRRILAACARLFLENGYTNAYDGKTYAHRYNAPFAARAYVKIGSSRYYGSCRTASLAETAQRIKETGGDAYTKNQAYIDNILAQADAILDE